MPGAAADRPGLRVPAVRDILAAGGAGGLAMVPLGVALELGAGHDINVYGELTVRALLGSAPAWALLVEHILISLTLAVPLLVVLDRCRAAPAALVGVLYGASVWLLVNSLLLPAIFARPTAWALGWHAVWPSFTLHVVYGATAALVLLAVARPSDRGTSPARVR